MRYVLILLALAGIVVASLALREHYRTEGDSPCSINAHWDCGIVNKSPFALIHGIPVADIGIAGYLLLAILAWGKSYRVMLAGTIAGLAFSLYLAHIEKDILGVWCIYCVCSLVIICLMALLSLIATITNRQPKSSTS
jgi:vitamin-K-epoxide reductase (warfarin-sensitive)